MEPDTLRALERIIAVIIGGLSIVLGYRLFLSMPEKTDSSGKVVLPGGISVYLTRVGPGVFFALFGAIVVAFSFYYGVTYSTQSPSEVRNAETTTELAEPSLQEGAVQQYAAAPVAPESTTYSGSVETETEHVWDPEFDPGYDRLLLDMDFINGSLLDLLKDDLTEFQRDEVKVLVPRIKLGLLKMNWKPDWGDFDEFREHVEARELGSVPRHLEKAAAIFRSGQESPQ